MATNVNPPPISSDTSEFVWKTWFQSVWQVVRTHWIDLSNYIFLGIGTFTSTIQPKSTLHIRSTETVSQDDGLIVEKVDTSHSGFIKLRRAMGTSESPLSPAPTTLGTIGFEALYSGDNWSEGATIKAVSQGSAGISGVATALSLSTSDGTASATPRLYISEKGDFALGDNPVIINKSTGYTRLSFGGTSSILSETASTNTSSMLISNNLEFASNQWTYITTGPASVIGLAQGALNVYCQTSGTGGTPVGAALSSSMTVSTTGLGVFNTNPQFPLDITHASSYARITNAWVGRLGGATTYASFGNTSFTNNTTNYAIAAGINGDTLLNCTNFMKFRLNNGDLLHLDGSNFTVNNVTNGLSVTTSAQTSALKLTDAGTNGPAVKFTHTSSTNQSYLRQNGTSMQIINDAYSVVMLSFSTSTFNTVGIKPGSDNTTTLGVSGTRWASVWAANGTIQTSDQRLKTAIVESNLGLGFIESLRPVSYKWKIGGNKVVCIPHKKDENGNEILSTDDHIVIPQPGKRVHYGLLAQEVKRALDDAKVEDFGGWVQDDMNDPDSTQSLNYAEFISPMIKAIQELSAKVKTLEAKLNA